MAWPSPPDRGTRYSKSGTKKTGGKNTKETIGGIFIFERKRIFANGCELPVLHALFCETKVDGMELLLAIKCDSQAFPLKLKVIAYLYVAN